MLKPTSANAATSVGRSHKFTGFSHGSTENTQNDGQWRGEGQWDSSAGCWGQYGA